MLAFRHIYMGLRFRLRRHRHSPACNRNPSNLL